MSIKFDVKLTCDDMYRFHLYHAYTSMQGILSIICGILIIVLIVFSGKFEGFVSAAPYVALALVFVLYIPVSLRFRSKRQILMSDALKDVLHYEVTEEGVKVTSDAQPEGSLLPWGSIYKAVTTKHNLLIYSSRVYAYIIPKEHLSEVLPQLYDALEKYCEDFRLHLKR